MQLRATLCGICSFVPAAAKGVRQAERWLAEERGRPGAVVIVWVGECKKETTVLRAHTESVREAIVDADSCDASGPERIGSARKNAIVDYGETNSTRTCFPEEAEPWCDVRVGDIGEAYLIGMSVKNIASDVAPRSGDGRDGVAVGRL